ncbi:MAG: ATP-binding protein [Synechococcales bacterium]|nr:ATP-binding protein [Synechococcales bacterium]
MSPDVQQFHPSQPHPKHQRPQRLSRLQVMFTLILTVPFALQVALVIGATTWLSYWFRQRAVEDVTTRLRTEISSQVYDRLELFLETPHLVNQINADAARLGQLDLDNIRGLELRFWRQIQTYDSLSSIGFGREDGAYVAGDRRDNAFRLGHRDADSPEGKLHMYIADEDGNPTILVYTGKPNYDPRVRPWYALGQQTDEGLWTEIFTYSSQPIYVISAVRALYDPLGIFQGVTITDLMLSDINQFLSGLRVGDSGEVFIMERSGQLVATSTAETPYEVRGAQEASRLQATESLSPRIRSTARFLWKEFGELTNIEGSQQFDVRLNGDRHFLQVLPYFDTRGIDWLIVVVLTESDLAPTAGAGRQSAIALALVALGVSLGVGWILSRWFVRPVANLAAAATDVAAGNRSEPIATDRNDELGALAIAFNQISKQLQSSLLSLEEQQAQLAESQQLAQLGSWDYDVAQQILTCSEELRRIFGIPPAQSVTVAQLYRQVHPADRPWVRALFQDAFEIRNAFEMDHRIRRRDGQVRFVYSKGRPVIGEMGQVEHILGTVMDITERKQTETALKTQTAKLTEANQLLTQTKLRLEERNRELDEFARVVSHDLKAPLRAIANLSTWIEEDLQERLLPENQEQMTLLRQRVARMEALISGLLRYSRAGRADVPFERVNVGDLLADVLDSLAPPDGMTIHLATDLPTLTARRLLLHQVFANLVSNAIKHHDRPDGQITIAVQDQESFYEFTVTDDGPGIDPHFHERIFGIFQTLPSRNPAANTGIGLSLVKKIVEMEGGTIWVKSQLGQGTAFHFTWPKVPDPNPL